MGRCKTVKNERTVFVDVDDTLVLHRPPVSEPTISIWDAVENKTVEVIAHQPMIRLLKEESYRGSHVVVWSRGGYVWAEAVIKALGLEDCVDQIMTKPFVYFDDKPIEEWLSYRVYLEPGTRYKP